MIDINYSDPTSLVRSNIGDPNTVFVSDNTITSALEKYEDDVNKASILIMETMLTYFSTQADESKTGDVEYKYTKLYERFKARLTEFKNENASISQVPIIIGGTTLSGKNAVVEDVDTFLPSFQDQWDTLQYQNKIIEEERDLWNV